MTARVTAMTRVSLHFGFDWFNIYVRFGHPVERQEPDRRRAFEFYSPGAIIGYVHWIANEFGTRAWQFWILQTARPNQCVEQVPGVQPGAIVLLAAHGKAAVKRAFDVIDDLERAGFDPADVSPAYYRHAHQRLSVRMAAHPYTADQHAAYLARKGHAS